MNTAILNYDTSLDNWHTITPTGLHGKDNAEFWSEVRTVLDPDIHDGISVLIMKESDPSYSIDGYGAVFHVLYNKLTLTSNEDKQPKDVRDLIIGSFKSNGEVRQTLQLLEDMGEKTYGVGFYKNYGGYTFEYNPQRDTRWGIASEESKENITASEFLKKFGPKDDIEQQNIYKVGDIVHLVEEDKYAKITKIESRHYHHINSRPFDEITLSANQCSSYTTNVVVEKQIEPLPYKVGDIVSYMHPRHGKVSLKVSAMGNSAVQMDRNGTFTHDFLAKKKLTITRSKLSEPEYTECILNHLGDSICDTQVDYDSISTHEKTYNKIREKTIESMGIKASDFPCTCEDLFKNQGHQDGCAHKNKQVQEEKGRLVGSYSLKNLDRLNDQRVAMEQQLVQEANDGECSSKSPSNKSWFIKWY